MAGLIAVDDLAEAMDVTFTAGETAKAQSLIDRLSAYVENYCQMSFQVVEDATVRVQADYYGMVELGEKYNNISAVGPITDPVTDDGVNLLTAGCARWNKLNTLFNLGPNQVVDVTLTYGLASCPADIAGVVMDAAIQGMGAGDASEIRTVQIGDRIEQYSSGKVESLVAAIGGISVLDDYRDGNSSLHLGHPRFEPQPTLDDFGWPSGVWY